MRTFLITITSFISILCNGQNYSVESQLLDCLYKTADNVGIDLKKEFDGLENYLIENKILEDSSGNSYYLIYKQIEKVGDINYHFNYSLIDTIKFHSDSLALKDFQKTCIEFSENIKNGEAYQKSKLYELNYAIDSLTITGILDVSAIASAITTVLSPNDFSHDYYKISAMLMLISAQDVIDFSHERLPPPDKNSNIKQMNSLNVMIDSSDRIIVTDRYIKFDGLDYEVTSYVLSNRDSSQIALKNSRQTSYAMYVKVYDSIVIYINNLRDLKSIETYGLRYNDLQPEIKKIINKEYPIMIYELDLE